MNDASSSKNECWLPGADTRVVWDGGGNRKGMKVVDEGGWVRDDGLEHRTTTR
jgi:hypothetical protein